MQYLRTNSVTLIRLADRDQTSGFDVSIACGKSNEVCGTTKIITKIIICTIAMSIDKLHFGDKLVSITMTMHNSFNYKNIVDRVRDTKMQNILFHKDKRLKRLYQNSLPLPLVFLQILLNFCFKD